MNTRLNPDEQNMIERIGQLKSPVVRRVIGDIADAVFAGRLTGEDMELLAGIADRIADRSESSLNDQELLMVKRFRQLNNQQREGAVMLLSAVTPNDPQA